MHISKAFTILAKEECNFLGGKLETDVLSSGDLKKARELMVNMVLATDMANHGVDLIELEHVLEAGSVDLSKPARTTLILKVCLHAADISNPAKPWDYYNQWTDRVLQEFHAQGDLEKSIGVPVSPGFDREKCTNIKYVVCRKPFPHASTPTKRAGCSSPPSEHTSFRFYTRQDRHFLVA